MEQQVEQAVACALSPHSDAQLKSQAIAYLDQVKASPDGWQLCLSIFVKEPKRPPEVRLFGLQGLDDALRNSSMDAQALLFLRQTLLEFVNREYVLSSVAEPQYLKNKLAQTITYLFLQQYPSEWPSFFDDLLVMTKLSDSDQLNVRMVDLFLRICVAVDEEIATVGISRGRNETARNTLIKDTMRERENQKLVAIWLKFLQEYRQSRPDIAELILRCIGGYVAWIDINLVVNDSFVSMLYQFMTEPQLCIAACECLISIIYKGMKPQDKLNLIQFLGLPDIIGRVNVAGETEFAEHVAKLVNVLGVILCQIWADNQVQDETRAATYIVIEKLLPYLLKFLADEYDDTSSAVFPLVSELLQLLKRQKKLAGSLSQPQQDFLLSLLRVVVMKMKYDESANWGGDDDEEEEALFLEMRKGLKVFFDNIAAIDETLFSSFVLSAVVSTLDRFQEQGSKMDWRDLELALYVLYLYGEAVKEAVKVGQMQFAVTQGGSTQLLPLGEMVWKMVTNNVSTHPHPSVALHFFENVVRYYQFFEIQPDCIPTVLGAFVDGRGLHHSKKSVRSRSWYLFYRFVKILRPRMGAFVERVLSSIQDLLVIEAELPPPSDAASESTTTASAGVFDNQIYLFETVGTLISHEAVPEVKQVEYLSAVLNPLLLGLQEYLPKAMAAGEDPLPSLQLHHLIVAVGSVAKGFPDAPSGQEALGGYAEVFKQSVENILTVLEHLNQIDVIREAARFSFSRLISCLGAKILPYLPPVITGLLTNCKLSELVDFLPFIGQIIYKFKPSIFNIVNDLLLPLVKRVFVFLNQTPSGTDEALMLIDLRKAYLNFIHMLFNSELERVFISDLNRPHLNIILQSILHYASDTSNVQSQKLAFGILLKMVNAWAENQANGTNSSVNLPGFDQFVYGDLVRACFEVPAKPGFDLTDGQTVLVVGEIALLQRAIFERGGAAFADYLREGYLPSIQCPPSLADEYVQALQQLDAKNFKKYFQTFVQKSKAL
ncbi:uncharacterized protein VTP21DRAFT_5668 [Calcarisporiella thermophila]|uniref:uncharacterized protein n=1 Tax=Calcarisporiella thermophila TaxID=911321 RepID=UPI00374462B8